MFKHFFAGLLALGLLAGCSQGDVNGTAVTRDSTVTAAEPAANTTTAYAQQWEDEPVTVNIARADETVAEVTEQAPATGFIHDAYQGSQKDVSLGELALRQSSSARVQAYAQMMIRDHGRAVRELEKLSADQGLSLQSESAVINESEDELSKLRGAAFDARFAEMMVDDHEKDVALFGREAREGLKQPLSDFAANKLPLLRQHLAMARELRESLKSNW